MTPTTFPTTPANQTISASGGLIKVLTYPGVAATAQIVSGAGVYGFTFKGSNLPQPAVGTAADWILIRDGGLNTAPANSDGVIGFDGVVHFKWFGIFWALTSGELVIKPSMTIWSA